MLGAAHAAREVPGNTTLPSADMGNSGGGMLMGSANEPTVRDYEAIFGPAARDIRPDSQRSKRHQRWHLPDMLKGPNPFLTDRVDGLITDATNSPFTTIILPYVYLPNPDAKIKWNVYSFDEGLATRVPYESGARVLTQSKTSHSGYAVRQGLAITMEHNFMMSEAGRQNFNNQLLQLVGSIQYTNDLDVHMALITAPSYERTMAEKFQYMDKEPSQVIRQYVDLFGIMQKNPNGLDVLIEETKQNMKRWGAKDPTFLLTNGKLCMQLNMNVERTQYLTNGYDGVRRLQQGPDMPKYRGLDVVHSRAFSLETGAPPRDLLNRRVRVAEYYHVPATSVADLLHERSYIELYDEGRDQMMRISTRKLAEMADVDLDGFVQPYEAAAFPAGAAAPVPGDLPAAVAAGNTGDVWQYFEAMRVQADVGYDHWIMADMMMFDYLTAPEGGLRLLRLLENGDRAEILRRMRSIDPDRLFQFVGLDNDNAVVVFDVANHRNIALRDFLVTLGYTATQVQDTITNARVIYRNAACNNGPLVILGLWNNPFMAFMPNGALAMCIHDGARAGITRELMQNTLLSTAGARKYCAAWGNMQAAAGVIIDDGAFNALNAIGLRTANAAFLGAANSHYELILVRPCIEHEMLGVVLGRGGTQELGATFWGQTELSCYDDAFHGKWGMSYKYHERAIVHNEKNLTRVWDVAFNGYTGGMGMKIVDWGDNAMLTNWKEKVNNLSEPYGCAAPDIMVMALPCAGADLSDSTLPNPVKFHGPPGRSSMIDPENIYSLLTDEMDTLLVRPGYQSYVARMPNFEELHKQRKGAGMASVESDTHTNSLAFQGTCNIHIHNQPPRHVRGAGHLGDSYVGCASVRSGRGMQTVIGSSGLHAQRIV